MIYIVSRDRVDVLEENVPKWIGQGAGKRFPLTVITETDEANDYKKMLRGTKIKVAPLPEGQTGVANSRNHAFHLAKKKKYPSFAVSDDDVVIKDDPLKLLRAAKTRNVLGVGAMYSIYTLMYGIQPYTGVYMSKYGGFGYCFYALNTYNMIRVGGWDKEWVGPGQMDHGLSIKGIVQLGLLWRIHSDVQIAFSMKEAVSGGGGIDTLLSDLGYKRMTGWHEWHKMAYERYPAYVNDPSKCKILKRSSGRCGLRYNWKKMIADNCPKRLSEYKGKAIPIRTKVSKR